MIVFYSKSCEGCSGNHALSSMKSFCEKKKVDFEERRTVLWEKYEEEADSIMELNEELKLPFFYNTVTGEVLEGNSFTPLDSIEKMVKNELKNTQSNG